VPAVPKHEVHVDAPARSLRPAARAILFPGDVWWWQWRLA
jgi:hypothetical protein